MSDELKPAPEITIRDICAEWLRAHGYDGLAHCEDADGCGCLLDDLMACGEAPDHCFAAYRHDCAPDEEDYSGLGYYLSAEKPAAKATAKDANAAEDGTPKGSTL